MNKIQLLLIMIVLAGQIACKSSNPIATERGKDSGKKKELSEKERIAFEYTFHNANKEKVLGNYEAAANLYAQCIKIDNSKATPFYELAGIYAMLGKNNYALEFSKQAAELDPSNQWFRMQYAELLLRNDQNEKAAVVYEKLSKENPDNPDYYLEWANSLILSNKFNDALKVYDQLEKLIGVSEDISVQKQRIFLSQGNFDKAIAETKRLVETFPLEARYHGMLADLYQSRGLDHKALETFKNILVFDPENPFVHLSLADFYNRTGENEKAFDHLEMAFLNPELDIDTKVKILLSYYMVTEKKNELKDEAFGLAEKLIFTHPNEAKSYAIYGDFLLREKKYTDARDQFRKAIDLEKDKFIIWNQLLLLESELNDFEAMEKESTEALELFPTQPSLYLFNGIASAHNKNFDKAIEMLEAGLVFIVDNPPLKGQFYSSLGDTYFKAGKHAKSDLAYEKALEIEPDNFYILNNYSYYLSLRNENLDRAEEMSKRSNELVPNSASFQDTYGWILFMQGKYTEARKWIEKAMENGGKENGVILEHYGDVLFKLDDFKNALEFWEKSQKTGGGSELLNKKIKEKKLIIE